MRLAIGLSIGLCCAATTAAAADSLSRATQSCMLVYRASPVAAAIIWSGGTDGRVVLYTVSGERIECMFVTPAGAIPRLSSLQSTAADQSVATMSGKALDKDNKLIADHFRAAGQQTTER